MKTKQCFYCKSEDAVNNDYAYERPMYKILQYSHFPPSRVSCESTSIFIPRCKKCYRKHLKFSTYLYVIPTWIVGILVTLLYAVNKWDSDDAVMVIIIALAFGGITILILNKIFYAFDRLFFKYFKSIPAEDDISNYPLIRKLKGHKWYKHIPNAHEITKEHISKELSAELIEEININNEIHGNNYLRNIKTPPSEKEYDIGNILLKFLIIGGINLPTIALVVHFELDKINWIEQLGILLTIVVALATLYYLFRLGLAIYYKIMTR